MTRRSEREANSRKRRAAEASHPGDVSVGDAARLGAGAGGTRDRVRAEDVKLSAAELRELHLQDYKRRGLKPPDEAPKASRRGVLFGGIGAALLVGTGAYLKWGRDDSTPEATPRTPATPGAPPPTTTPQHPYTRLGGPRAQKKALWGSTVFDGTTSGESTTAKESVMKTTKDGTTTHKRSGANFPVGKLESGQSGFAVYDISGLFGGKNSTNQNPSLFSLCFRGAEDGITFDFQGRTDGQPGMEFGEPRRNQLITQKDPTSPVELHFNKDERGKTNCETLVGEGIPVYRVNSNHVKLIVAQKRTGEKEYTTDIGLVNSKKVNEALKQFNNNVDQAVDHLMNNRIGDDAFIGLFSAKGIGQMLGIDRAQINGDTDMSYSLNNAYLEVKDDDSWASTWHNKSQSAEVTDHKIRQLFYMAAESELATRLDLQGPTATVSPSMPAGR